MFHKLVAGMQQLYGSRFTQAWEGFTVDEIVEVWKSELEGYSFEEVKDGVRRMRANLGDWPPGIGEFQRMCRPFLDPEYGCRVAVAQLRFRKEGKDNWPHPALYWAAVEIGEHTMTSLPHDKLVKRWAEVFERVYARDDLAPVPVAALPPPDASKPAGRSRVADRELEKIAEILSKPSDAARKGRAAGWIHVGGAHGIGS